MFRIPLLLLAIALSFASASPAFAQKWGRSRLANIHRYADRPVTTADVEIKMNHLADMFVSLIQESIEMKSGAFISRDRTLDDVYRDAKVVMDTVLDQAESPVSYAGGGFYISRSKWFGDGLGYRAPEKPLLFTVLGATEHIVGISGFIAGIAMGLDTAFTHGFLPGIAVGLGATTLFTSAAAPLGHAAEDFKEKLMIIRNLRPFWLRVQQKAKDARLPRHMWAGGIEQWMQQELENMRTRTVCEPLMTPGQTQTS